VIERDATLLAGVLLHPQFFVEKDAKVTHNSDWFLSYFPDIYLIVR